MSKKRSAGDLPRLATDGSGALIKVVDGDQEYSRAGEDTAVYVPVRTWKRLLGYQSSRLPASGVVGTQGTYSGALQEIVGLIVDSEHITFVVNYRESRFNMIGDMHLGTAVVSLEVGSPVIWEMDPTPWFPSLSVGIETPGLAEPPSPEIVRRFDPLGLLKSAAELAKRQHQRMAYQLIEPTEKNKDRVLTYSMDFPREGTLQERYNEFVEVDRQIKAFAERIKLGIDVEESICDDEKQFTVSVIIPLLLAMGYEEVRYTHGPAERRCDVRFSEVTRHGSRRHMGMQVKAFDIRGGASGQASDIARLVDDAFRLPFVSQITFREELISEFIYVTSKRFSEEAKVEISKLIQSPAAKSNTYFWDLSDVTNLLSRYVSSAASPGAFGGISS